MKFLILLTAVLILLKPFTAARGGEVVYVVNSYVHTIPQPEFSTVMMLRGSDLKILKALRIPRKDAHTGILTPDGCELWVTCSNGNSVAVIDTKSFELIKIFDYSGEKPMGLAVGPGSASRSVYAGIRDINMCRYYNSSSLAELPIPHNSGVSPEFLVFSPNGKLCVVDYSGRQVCVRNLSVPDSHTYSLSGGGLGDAVVSPDGSRLYVANKELSRIECLSVSAPYVTLAQYTTIGYDDILISRPRGIGISPDGDYLFTAHQIPGGSKVVMWQINPFWAEVARADLPENGRRIAVNKDCTRIYVADHDADRVFAYRVNVAGESMFLAPPYAGTDLNTIEDYQASPIGITVGEWDNIGVFRESSGLWAIKGVTRAYFGRNGDIPVPGKYGAVGGPGIGIFRPFSGLWAIKGVTRAYFGGSSDIPVPGDYDGDDFDDMAVFRPSSGLWAVRGATRFYFGRSGDRPVPGDYNGDGTAELAIFRGSSGLWASPSGGRLYFGINGDIPVPGDYLAEGNSVAAGIFRPASGLWAIVGTTRIYFGRNGDEPVPADFDGDGKNDFTVFRDSSGLWSVRNVTRAYFGSESDVPVSR